MTAEELIATLGAIPPKMTVAVGDHFITSVRRLDVCETMVVITPPMSGAHWISARAAQASEWGDLPSTTIAVIR